MILLIGFALLALTLFAASIWAHAVCRIVSGPAE
jgi:hypothetical protein